MADKIIVSPGVYTSEKDLSFIAQQVGVTTLGLVGETVKGPAFEPIFVSNYSEFTTLFGGQNPEKFGSGVPKYELPYIAKSYLSQSNQLFVTRVLGLTGYDAGKAWVITCNSNYDPSTIVSGITTSTFTANFTGTTYGNISDVNVGYLNTLGLLPNAPTMTTTEVVPNDVDSYPEGVVLTKVGSSFTGVSATVTLTSLTGVTGTVSGTVVTYSASSYTQYENKVLAVLRSRGQVVSDILYFDTDQSSSGVQISVPSSTNPLVEFTLSAFTSGFTSGLYYNVSLDKTSQNYITKVLGTDFGDKESMIFVEENYSSQFDDLVNNNYILGINSSLVYLDDVYNYKQEYQTPETPWIVSELRGNSVEKLFKFISISDGSDANQEIKISIQNIDLDNKLFDVVIRSWNDTDAKPVILESYSKCSMDSTANNYVAQKIGTADGEFALRSKYVMLVVNPNADYDSFPAGFEGYRVRDYGSALAPDLEYKTSYDPTNEKIRKVYLGISDTVGIDQNMFNWKGYDVNDNLWSATTKGFHMDSGATIAGDFSVGVSSFKSVFDIEGTDYETAASRKFTLVPYFGFDGWNEYRTNRTNTDRYKVGKVGYLAGSSEGEFSTTTTEPGTSDYYAYLQAYETMKNPESVNINVLATPGIDYGSNANLVNEVIEIVEENRADSIYILNSPDGVEQGSGDDLSGFGFNKSLVTTPDDIVGMLDDSGIDSNYTATYWPWIQEKDTENNVNVWLSPTLEVVRNIALTDNISFPWYASAGYSRGTTRALQARVKLTEEQRDTLYDGRINPMTTFSDEGVLIWGNKNLQEAESLLNRLNIRRLLLQARKLISAVSLRLLFEQNDQIVRNQFLSLVNPILDNIRKERGLSDFRVVLSNDPEDIDRNELKAKIFLKPVATLEFIQIEFVVTPTGVSFDDI